MSDVEKKTGIVTSVWPETSRQATGYSSKPYSIRHTKTGLVVTRNFQPLEEAVAEQKLVDQASMVKENDYRRTQGFFKPVAEPEPDKSNIFTDTRFHVTNGLSANMRFRLGM